MKKSLEMEFTDITPNSRSDDDQTDPLILVTTSKRERYRNGITMFVIFLINLLNYMDRFTIAGVLEKIQTDFGIDDAWGGLLQTVFVCSYMTLAPLFGYLGDRYSRKLLIVIGVTLWSMTTLAGSFIPKTHFWAFLVLRGAVGIGEASYSCVAPTIIADIYRGDMRTLMFAVFNIAVPAGSGLGYIVGSYIAQAFSDWRWALRFTPVLGIVCVFLLILLVREPARGAIDGGELLKNTKWIQDVREIFKVKSFVLTTLAFTWVAFALGALSWWAPKYLQYAELSHNKTTNNDEIEAAKAQVSLIFGIITCFAGLTGVILGSEAARRYRKRNKRADPLVCGIAVILSAPFLAATLYLSKDYPAGTWICIFITETLLCTNWALISDMLMYIIIPTRRSTAGAIQIFIMHLLGDASSPYIVGLISDFFQSPDKTYVNQWIALRYGLLITPFVSLLGGVAFLIAAIFIVDDRLRAENSIESDRIQDTFPAGDDQKL